MWKVRWWSRNQLCSRKEAPHIPNKHRMKAEISASASTIDSRKILEARLPWSGNWRADDGWLDLGKAIHTVNALSIGVWCHAVSGNVSGLAALVAHLSSGIEGPSIRCSAVPGDVALLQSAQKWEDSLVTDEFSTCIALHGLCLAVSSVVIRTSAFVAHCRSRATRATRKASSHGTSKPSSRDHDTTTDAEAESCTRACSLFQASVRNVGKRTTTERTARWPGCPQV